MIQDILTYTTLIISIVLFIRSFIRFFTVRTNESRAGSACAQCEKGCPLKSVMDHTNQIIVEQK